MYRKCTYRCTLWIQPTAVKSIEWVLSARAKRVHPLYHCYLQALIATGPLCVYVSGFITSFPMRTVNQCLGRKSTMVLGLGAILFSSFLFWSVFYLQDAWGLPMQWTVIASAILLGIGITTAQITSSAFASDLIGRSTVR